MMKNYYDILGVTPDSDIETIKFSYKALAKIYYPDTYKGDKKYAEIKINELIQYVRLEAEKIGGEFRGPGIKARVYKEMANMLRGTTR